jgi:hypothetical protein
VPSSFVRPENAAAKKRNKQSLRLKDFIVVRPYASRSDGYDIS